MILIKRIKAVALILTMLTSLSITASNAEIVPEVYNNGYKIEFAKDQEPYINSKGKVMIPFRVAIEDILKSQLIHNKDAKIVITETKPKLIVSLIKLEIINEDNDIVLPREEVEVKNNRLYIPLRFLVDNFYTQVAWNNNTKSAYMTTDGTYPVIPKHGVIIAP